MRFNIIRNLVAGLAFVGAALAGPLVQGSSTTPSTITANATTSAAAVEDRGLAKRDLSIVFDHSWTEYGLYRAHFVVSGGLTWRGRYRSLSGFPGLLRNRHANAQCWAASTPDTYYFDISNTDSDDGKRALACGMQMTEQAKMVYCMDGVCCNVTPLRKEARGIASADSEELSAVSLNTPMENTKREPYMLRVDSVWTEAGKSRVRFTFTGWLCDDQAIQFLKNVPQLPRKKNWQCWYDQNIFGEGHADVSANKDYGSIHPLACQAESLTSGQFCIAEICCDQGDPPKLARDIETIGEPGNITSAAINERDLILAKRDKAIEVIDQWYEWLLWRVRFLATDFSCDDIEKMLEDATGLPPKSSRNFQCWTDDDLEKNQIYLDVSTFDDFDGQVNLACAIGSLIDSRNFCLGPNTCCAESKKAVRDVSAARHTDVAIRETTALTKRVDMDFIYFVNYILPFYQYARIRFQSNGYTCGDIDEGIKAISYPRLPRWWNRNFQCCGDLYNPTFDISTYNGDKGLYYVACALSYVIDPTQSFNFKGYFCTYDTA